jgi:polysaccharide pyruvyl transferase WcaK-like protein
LEKFIKKNILLAGCSPGTSNLGVDALCYSAVAGLKSADSSINITILDFDDGLRPKSYSIDNGISCDMIGAKHTQRVYKPSSFLNISLLGSLPFSLTKQVRIFKEAAAVLDISGGDSFTDLYGKYRFDAIMFPKLLAKKFKKPLILLPQTYGPFADPKNFEMAADILKYADLALARDEHSFGYMKEMLGDSFDSDKHKLTTDVAFIMPASDRKKIEVSKLLPKKDAEEVYGINVSGLIYNSPTAAKTQYGINLNYNNLVQRIVTDILSKSKGEVWLIPHVIAERGSYESDIDACEDVKKSLDISQQDRVKIISGNYDQCDIKAVIKECTWFTGTRMHATIAGLSSKIPTVGMAYSGKFQGVFESVGQGDSVVDLRTLTEEEAYQTIIKHWQNRDEHLSQLEECVPAVLANAKYQFDTVASALDSALGNKV